MNPLVNNDQKNLNTSHVAVKQGEKIMNESGYSYLNTSHVAVKHYNLIALGTNNRYLNTSHVAVKPSQFQHSYFYHNRSKVENHRIS